MSRKTSPGERVWDSAPNRSDPASGGTANFRPLLPDPTLTFSGADPMFVVDDRLCIVLWNRPLEELLAQKAEEVVGDHCYNVMGCPDRSGSGRSHHACLDLVTSRRQAAVPTHNYEVRTTDGRRVWVSVSTIVVSSALSDTCFLVHVVRDISRQRDMEEFVKQVRARMGALCLPPEAEASRSHASPIAIITLREREVLNLLALGASTADIASRLGISPATARNHVQNLLTKLEVHNRLEAVTLALRRGLI
jgi:PAS domain S-box-containing protein